MPDLERDRAMRLAAFQRLAALLAQGPIIPAAELQYGFEFDGQQIRMSHQQGIWKPRDMAYILSLRTGTGRDARQYADHHVAESRVAFGAEDTIEYSFRGDDPEQLDNRRLVEAFAEGVPLIYLLGVAGARYVAAAPVYISEVDKLGLSCQLVVGSPDRGISFGIPDAEERAEGMRMFRERLQRARPSDGA